ncbi:ribokinase protein [Apiospora hydei]|uniref:Ribokinase protein n=1 Tax=Apiospora hydei TaxID=1337664 RepID=A0ABR1UUR6_9PEZI
MVLVLPGIMTVPNARSSVCYVLLDHPARCPLDERFSQYLTHSMVNESEAAVPHLMSMSSMQPVQGMCVRMCLDRIDGSKDPRGMDTIKIAHASDYMRQKARATWDIRSSVPCK